MKTIQQDGTIELRIIQHKVKNCCNLGLPLAAKGCNDNVISMKVCINLLKTFKNSFYSSVNRPAFINHKLMMSENFDRSWFWFWFCLEDILAHTWVRPTFRSSTWTTFPCPRPLIFVWGTLKALAFKMSQMLLSKGLKAGMQMTRKGKYVCMKVWARWWW